VVGISGIDTRALTRHLRERGAMRVGVSSVDSTGGAAQAGARRARHARRRPVAEVSTPQPYTVAAEGEHRYTVAALDLGIKRNVARRLAARGVDHARHAGIVHTGRSARGRRRTRCSSRPARATRPPPTTGRAGRA
jgi:carbamoylphosphate synthase small subunit